MRDEVEDERRWHWQGRHQLSRVALELVFSWLEGAELARAGAVCRAWRQVAAAPALWRRLYAAHARLPRAAQLVLLDTDGKVGWRQLYVEAVAGWELTGHLEPSCMGLLHASLSPDGDRLALLASDATVSIWERSGDGGEGQGAWWERGGLDMRGRGWIAAERGEWARDGARLLVAGRRALLAEDAWELLVLAAPDQGGTWAPRARARASGGAAGCWADANGDAFLSFELRLLAPALAATTVWLNAATQETHSEYAGVAAPLLRIFNEDGHLLSALVAEVPAEEGDGEAYVRATRGAPGRTQVRVLVAAWGRAGRGALGAWALTERRPPPVVAAAAGDLSARLRRRAAARRAPAQPEQEPTEAEVRALCTPPDAVCRLPARPAGVAVHPNGRCVWACWAGGGGACLSLPALTPLRVLAPLGPAGDPVAVVDHYVQPSASRAFFAAPTGGMGGEVRVWGAGAAPLPLRHRGPALAALLLAPPRGDAPFSPETLLVLTTDRVHVWRSRVTLQPCFE